MRVQSLSHERTLSGARGSGEVGTFCVLAELLSLPRYCSKNSSLRCRSVDMDHLNPPRLRLYREYMGGSFKCDSRGTRLELLTQNSSILYTS